MIKLSQFAINANMNSNNRMIVTEEIVNNLKTWQMAKTEWLSTFPEFFTLN